MRTYVTHVHTRPSGGWRTGCFRSVGRCHRTSVGEFHWTSVGKRRWKPTMISEVSISGVLRSVFIISNREISNWASQIDPKSKYVAYLSVLSQISNCQGLGRKNKHEILKTDRRGRGEWKRGSEKEWNRGTEVPESICSNLSFGPLAQSCSEISRGGIPTTVGSLPEAWI